MKLSARKTTGLHDYDQSNKMYQHYQYHARSCNCNDCPNHCCHEQCNCNDCNKCNNHAHEKQFHKQGHHSGRDDKHCRKMMIATIVEKPSIMSCTMMLVPRALITPLATAHSPLFMAHCQVTRSLSASRSVTNHHLEEVVDSSTHQVKRMHSYSL